MRIYDPDGYCLMIAQNEEAATTLPGRPAVCEDRWPQM